MPYFSSPLKTFRKRNQAWFFLKEETFSELVFVLEHRKHLKHGPGDASMFFVFHLTVTDGQPSTPIPFVYFLRPTCMTNSKSNYSTTSRHIWTVCESYLCFLNLQNILWPHFTG